MEPRHLLVDKQITGCRQCYFLKETPEKPNKRNFDFSTASFKCKKDGAVKGTAKELFVKCPLPVENNLDIKVIYGEIAQDNLIPELKISSSDALTEFGRLMKDIMMVLVEKPPDTLPKLRILVDFFTECLVAGTSDAYPSPYGVDCVDFNVVQDYIKWVLEHYPDTLSICENPEPLGYSIRAVQRNTARAKTLQNMTDVIKKTLIKLGEVFPAPNVGGTFYIRIEGFGTHRRIYYKEKQNG